MIITLSYVTGVMVGFEFYSDEGTNYLLLDLFIVRIVIAKVSNEDNM